MNRKNENYLACIDEDHSLARLRSGTRLYDIPAPFIFASLSQLKRQYILIIKLALALASIYAAAFLRPIQPSPGNHLPAPLLPSPQLEPGAFARYKVYQSKF